MATNVKIVDELPAGMMFVSASSTPVIGSPTQAANILTWPTIGTLAPSAQGDVLVTAMIGTGVADCTSMINKAGLQASNELSQYSGNNNTSAAITMNCPTPDVWTTKTVSAVSGFYLPGMTVEYTLNYGNQ